MFIGCRCGTDDVVTDIVTSDGVNGRAEGVVVMSIFTGNLCIVTLGLDIGLPFGRLGFEYVTTLGDKTVDAAVEGEKDGDGPTGCSSFFVGWKRLGCILLLGKGYVGLFAGKDETCGCVTRNGDAAVL
jgi:hypothetical protein